MKSRIVYAIGAPGTGKSTLIIDVAERLGLAFGEPEVIHSKANVRNLVRLRATPLLAGEERAGIYLGVLRGVTSGTDALDKACPPVAKDWAESEDLPAVVLSEGMRLCFNDFLLSLDRRADLLLVHLSADGDELARRYAARGTSQSEQFIRNGTTRSRRVAEDLRAAGARVLDLDSSRWVADPDDYALVVDLLADWVLARPL